MTSQAKTDEPLPAVRSDSDALSTTVLVALMATIGLVGGAGLCFWALRGAAITWDIATVFCL